MTTLAWLGSDPPPPLRKALTARDVRVVLGRERGDDAGGRPGSGSGARPAAHPPRVVFTASARPPLAPPGVAPWLWLSAAALGDSVRVEAARRGAYDALSLLDARAADRLAARARELCIDEAPVPAAPEMVAVSAASKQLVRQIARAARTSMPVLLTGETGTGKEVAARLIHAWSARASFPFVPINCAALPNELMEAELFGYARGAFSARCRATRGCSPRPRAARCSSTRSTTPRIRCR